MKIRLRGTGNRLRAPLIEDPYGGAGTERDWANATTTPYPSLTQPRRATEESQDRAQTIGDWRAFLHPDADVTPADRWVHKGKTYQIHSAVLEDDLAGVGHHIELDLSIIEG